MECNYRTVENLRVLHGYVLEPALQCATLVAIECEQRLTRLAPEDVVDPDFDYPYTLERALATATTLFRGSGAPARRSVNALTGQNQPITRVDDIAALSESVGGRALLCGFSSGGAVALRAAADVGVEKLVVYETPFKTDPTAKDPTDDYGARLEQLVAAGDRVGASKHFMRTAVGLPEPAVASCRACPCSSPSPRTATR